MVREAQLPAVYRIWFTWIDPLIIAFAVYMNLFETNWMANLFSHEAFNYHHHAFLYHLGGSLAAIGILQVFLLRRTDDLSIWKLVQWAVLTCDAFYFIGQIRAMYYHNRFWTITDWWKEDWAVLLFLMFTAALRISFILGAGVRESRRAQLLMG